MLKAEAQRIWSHVSLIATLAANKQQSGRQEEELLLLFDDLIQTTREVSFSWTSITRIPSKRDSILHLLRIRVQNQPIASQDMILAEFDLIAAATRRCKNTPNIRYLFIGACNSLVESIIKNPEVDDSNAEHILNSIRQSFIDNKDISPSYAGLLREHLLHLEYFQKYEEVLEQADRFISAFLAEWKKEDSSLPVSASDSLRLFGELAANACFKMGKLWRGAEFLECTRSIYLKDEFGYIQPERFREETVLSINEQEDIPIIVSIGQSGYSLSIICYYTLDGAPRIHVSTHDHLNLNDFREARSDFVLARDALCQRILSEAPGSNRELYENQLSDNIQACLLWTWENIGSFILADLQEIGGTQNNIKLVSSSEFRELLLHCCGKFDPVQADWVGLPEACGRVLCSDAVFHSSVDMIPRDEVTCGSVLLDCIVEEMTFYDKDERPQKLPLTNASKTELFEKIEEARRLIILGHAEFQRWTSSTSCIMLGGEPFISNGDIVEDYVADMQEVLLLSCSAAASEIGWNAGQSLSLPTLLIWGGASVVAAPLIPISESLGRRISVCAQAFPNERPIDFAARVSELLATPEVEAEFATSEQCRQILSRSSFIYFVR